MNSRAPNIRTALAITALLACSSAACVLVDATMPPPAAAQQMEVDDGYFYSSLAQDGQWFYQAQFGWVWHPTRVDAGWRPYTDGQWVWTNDAGWVWATTENWGWATYHYGRWYFDPIYAWTWVPGRVWAPAWVSWRVEAGYVGWAPLWPVYFDTHPEYRWDRWGHDDDWNRRHGGRDWDRWVFTRDRDFTSDHVGRYAISDRRERDRVFASSRDVTQWDENNPERLGRSIDPRVIEKATGRPVRAVRVQPSDRREQRYDAGAGSLEVFRPRIKQSPDKTPDRLGLAKPPAKDARLHDTIREEKNRLDAVPAKNKPRDTRADEPAMREKNQDRGGNAGPRVRTPDKAEDRSGENSPAVQPPRGGKPQENTPRADRPAPPQKKAPHVSQEKAPQQQQQQQRQRQQEEEQQQQQKKQKQQGNRPPQAGTVESAPKHQANPDQPQQRQSKPTPAKEQRKQQPASRPDAPESRGMHSPQGSSRGGPPQAAPAEPSSQQQGASPDSAHGKPQHAPKGKPAAGPEGQQPPVDPADDQKPGHGPR